MRNTDFDGDGHSDILWRDASGLITSWSGTANGGFVSNSWSAVVSPDWQVLATGDFNGDAKTDVLFIQNSGFLTDWLGASNGAFVYNWTNAAEKVPSNWIVAGTGDFNGDHRDDILWWNYNGAVTYWEGTASGGFQSVPQMSFAASQWNVAGTGDFNGDGRDDILWRNAGTGALTDWLSTGTGFANDAHGSHDVDTSWQVAGVGDFDGDHLDDILWRNASTGALTDWMSTASGFVANNANALQNVPLSWQVASVGDYNGDGRDDILWRHDSGRVSEWLGSISGGFTGNDAVVHAQIATNWTIQPHWDPWAY